MERRDSKHHAREARYQASCESERGMGWGFQQDFALRTDACVICWDLRWLQSLPGSAADCARMHASKQGMRDESTRRASTVRARDVRRDGFGRMGWRGEIASIMRERRDIKHHARASEGWAGVFSKILRYGLMHASSVGISGGSRVCLGRLQIVRACTRASKACVMRALGERALCVRGMCVEMGSGGWVGEAR